MTSDEFLIARLTFLAEITHISAPRWSRYIRGVISPRESTINTAAEALHMTPPALLAAMQRRRECLAKADTKKRRPIRTTPRKISLLDP